MAGSVVVSEKKHSQKRQSVGQSQLALQEDKDKQDKLQEIQKAY